MRPRFCMAVLPAFVFFTGYSGIATGSDVAPPETVIVTASHTPVPMDQVGSAVTVFDAADLEARQSPILADVLRGAPGLAISRSGVAGSQTQLRMRGAEGNQVLVLIDGIEANDPAQGGEFNFAHALTDDVERVEIVRGPQSALWGSDALAGVVNVVTRRGRPGWLASGFAEGGSFDSMHAGASLSGAGETHDFRLGGSMLHSEGSNISRSGGEDDGYDNRSVNLVAGWRPLAALSLQVTGRHVAGTNEYDGTDFMTGLPADAELETEFEQNYGQVQGKLGLFEGRWEHSLSAAVTDTDNNNLDSGVQTDSAAGQRQRFAYKSDVYLDTPHMWDTKHVLSVVAEYEHENYRQRGTASPFGDPNQDLSMYARGLAGEYRVVFSEAVSLSASVRHDDNSDFQDDASWRLNGSWAFRAPGTRLRASYGTGSKNPTFVERFGFFTSSSNPSFVGNPSLQPEASSGWEIGADQALLEGRIRLALTWFEQDLEDEINGFVFEPARGVFTALNMAGKSERRGVELAGAMALLPGLDMDAAYTWLDATEPDAVTGRQAREVRRPMHNAALTLNWRFAGDRANLNFNVQYNGEQKDLYFPPPFFAAVPVTLDDFVLVTLAGSWQFTPQLSLFGRVENLLDQDYEELLGFTAPGIAAFAGLRLSLVP